MAVHSTAQMSPQIASALKNAAEVTGVDFKYLMDTAARESGFRASVKAPTSSASGLFQFIESTWLQMVKEKGAEFGMADAASHISKTSSGKYVVNDPQKRIEILELRNNPEAASVMAGVFTKMNSAHMESTIGRKPTAGELYIAHFLGSSNGGKLVRAAELNPTMKAADLFPSAARSNKSLFYRRGKTVSVKGLYQNLVRRHAAFQNNVAVAKASKSVEIGSKIKGIAAADAQQDRSISKWNAEVVVSHVQSHGLFDVTGGVGGVQKIADSGGVSLALTSGATVQTQINGGGQIGIWGSDSVADNSGGGIGIWGREQQSLQGTNSHKKQGPILGSGVETQDRARGLFVKGGLGRLKG